MEEIVRQKASPAKRVSKAKGLKPVGSETPSKQIKKSTPSLKQEKPVQQASPSAATPDAKAAQPVVNVQRQQANPTPDKITKAMTLKELDEKTLKDLRKIAEDLKVRDFANYNKGDLIIKILEEQTRRGGNIFAEGILEIVKDNSHGVLRSYSLVPSSNDVYVSGSQIKRFNLRPGDFISGQARPPKDGERYLSMLRIEAVNNANPNDTLTRPSFAKLTPVFPNEQIILETEPHVMATRLIDLLCPIGKGQRGMIVAPPKVGKTWLIRDIAKGIRKNHPAIHLMILLIGERPEEVTDMQRSVDAEVIAANFDESPETHTRIADLAIERAKRLVEQGKDVVILMDSITRLARAYNITAPPSGRTLSGGFDPVAIYPPKKFFGAARNFETAGSLTIVATALVETGSRMDEVIFEEFKGTGNMEMRLSRKLAQKRVYPAIDVKSSSTRNDDLLLSPDVLNSSWRVRRMLDVMNNEDEAAELLIERMRKTKNNQEFLARLHEEM